MENEIKNPAEDFFWKYRSWDLEGEVNFLISSAIKFYDRIALLSPLNNNDSDYLDETLFFVEQDLKKLKVHKIGTFGEKLTDNHCYFHNNDLRGPGLVNKFSVVAPAWIREINGDTVILKAGIGEQL